MGRKKIRRNRRRDARTYTGVVNVTARGVGYVELEGFEQDIEIPPHSGNTALDGDVVAIRLDQKRDGKRQTGRVEKVLKRARTEFVGTVEKENGDYFLIPDDRKVHVDFLIMRPGKQLKSNTKAQVRLTRWDDPTKDPEAEILKVLGRKGEHEAEMQSIVLSYGFDTDFPIPVQREAKKIAEQKQLLFEAEAKGRKDLRKEITFTIDPSDAKDFDDSISVGRLPGGDIEIGVHIADVGAYVKEGGAIDTEAQKRGTSMYLVDRTIPMLPEVLSNDLCSLNPNEDKLTFSAVFTLSKDGTVKKRWFGETITNSDKRFTYSEAQVLLDSMSNRPNENARSREILDTKKGAFFEELSIANELAKTLRKNRLAKGGLAFDQDEIKFKLDEKGKPIDIFVKERLETNLLIEDFMLLANREVAEYVYRLCREISGRDAVFVYRIHNEPDREKIDQLAIFLKAIGYELSIHDGIISSKSLNELFEKIEGTPEEHLIKTATIRSMAKAVYSTKNIGHFGLAFRYYTHFTSPIRRYPDLLVHRILKRHLDGTPVPQKEYAKYERLSIEASEREVAAVEAERASVKYKQVEYMKERIGQEFEGVITGVTEWGIFVEELKTKAEGMVRLATLKDDYYEVGDHGYHLVGKRTKKKYSLGDRVRVKLIAADLKEKTLEWKLIQKTD